MNGEHQSVATAPLDLRTTNRDRGSAGSRSPSCGLETSLVLRSPASPASTGTNGLEIRCSAVRGAPDSRTTIKRPADSSSLKLPFRKRRILVEPESETQSPAPAESGDRLSPVEDTDLAFRESSAGRLERAADDHRVGVAPVTPRRIEETQQMPDPDRCPIRILHPIHYGKLCCQTLISLISMFVSLF